MSSISSSILWKYYSGYVTALMMLNWKHGCQNYLLASYEKEIKGIPQSKPEDPSGFRALQYLYLDDMKHLKLLSGMYFYFMTHFVL